MVADVVVIGAGVAGLSAATALAERGLDVHVLEARPSGGGRCSAFTDPVSGERVDNGQHVLFGCYRETFRFLRRIDAASGVRLQPTLRVGIVDRDGRRSHLACPAWPAPMHLAGGLLRWPALDWRDRIATLRLVRALRSNRRPAATTTVRDWLRANGQSTRLIELLWEPLAVAALNESIDVAAAEPFRTVLARMFSSEREDSSIALPVVPLDELFVTPSRLLIERSGGRIETSSRARVELEPQAAGLAVRIRETTLRPAAVVCAVAWHALPEVLPPVVSLSGVVDAARAATASAIVTVNLWFDRPVIDEPFVGMPGRDMQWIFDKQRLFGERSSHLSLVSSAADRLAAKRNDEILDIAVGEVHAAFPASRHAAIARSIVVREKRATFSVAPGQPGRPGTVTSVPGLFLAGDWIDTGLPATIESAATSGHRAADAVLEYLKR
jgi:zeta-carotene desaturase